MRPRTVGESQGCKPHAKPRSRDPRLGTLTALGSSDESTKTLSRRNFQTAEEPRPPWNRKLYN